MRLLGKSLSPGLHITLLILAGFPSPRPLAAQADSAGVAGATLKGWEEKVRLAIFDRGGSFHGRLSEFGILQRFNEDMDSEYDLDVLSAMFSPADDFRWYRLKSGARFWSGSIDHLQQVQQGDFKASLDLGSSWAVDVAFTYEETLRAQRAVPIIAFSRRIANDESRAFLRGTLKALKPDVDIELGAVLTPAGGRLTIAAAALDLFSDVNFQALEVDPRISERAIDYTSHPFALRTTLAMPIGSRWRVEAHGLVLTPTRLFVESQTDPDNGFVQDERYAYAGALSEWKASREAVLGFMATWVRARTDRKPLPDGSSGDDFDLTEKTWRVGPYAILRLPGRLSLEAWITYVGRTEDRVRPEGARTTRYDDRTWAGRNALIYRANGGFRGALGLDFTARRTSGPIPVETLTPLERDNYRVRFDLGWEFDRKALFLLGAKLDLDDGSFDGGHGRFRLAW